MFVLPGRVYAINVIDALDKIHEQVAARGLKYIGPITLSKCDTQTDDTMTWFEFYCKAEEIGADIINGNKNRTVQ
jgi:tellurite resistance-related uncharacterized protein